jgi:deoxyadenosine/deoxycytidine kinase
LFVLINGPLGIGKSTTAFQLHNMFDNSIYLDGDFICRVHPFDLDDPNRVDYMARTIKHLIPFHRKNGYHNFVFNYVFPESKALINFIGHIKEIDIPIRTFLLTCDDQTLLERVEKRGREGKVESEIERCLVLNSQFQKNNINKELGTEISTIDLSVHDTAKKIFDSLE